MSDAQNPEYPRVSDKEMGQLAAYEKSLHGVLGGMFDTYPRAAGVHQIGESLHQIQALAHDMEWLAEGLYERYQRADESERAARLLTE